MGLAERMNATVPGQVTWANPDLGRRCNECIHIQLASRPSQHNRHVCGLVKLVSGRSGVNLNAHRAIACSKFEAIDNKSVTK